MLVALVVLRVVVRCVDCVGLWLVVDGLVGCDCVNGCGELKPVVTIGTPSLNFPVFPARVIERQATRVARITQDGITVTIDDHLAELEYTIHDGMVRRVSRVFRARRWPCTLVDG